MFKKTESLAWFVMMASFCACIALAVGVPLGVRHYVLTSMRPMVVILQRREGIVTQRASSTSASIVVDDEVEISPKSRVQGSSDADALLLFYHPDRLDAPVATIQLYGNTDLVVEDAGTPRFAASKLPHHIELEVSQ